MQVPFTESRDFSIGVELKFQIINPYSFNLDSKAKDLIRAVRDTEFEKFLKPEVTQSMLEINSSIHNTPQTLFGEFEKLQLFLKEQEQNLNVSFCGGGTHPFQRWVSRKIFPTSRFRELAKRYQYQTKRSTVFGQHIHIGCSNPEDALYLTHILARFVPQFIAISASSPFYQGVDTGYQSSRITIFNNYPLYGILPYVKNWQEFSDYFYKMQNLGIIESMKDFYWDVRPKPEFGTVEVRVCDTPLTFEKAIIMAAYVQTLSCYILRDRPYELSPEVMDLHSYNRFQSARFGLEGTIINPYTLEKKVIMDDILETIDLMTEYTQSLGNEELIAKLKTSVINKQNDTALLREILNERQSMKEVVNEQCRLWLSH